MWIKVTNDFADWLEMLIPKIEKATANAKTAAEKAKQAMQVQVATPKNVKAVETTRVQATTPKRVSKAATKPKKVKASAPNRVSKAVTQADSGKEMGWGPKY